MLSHYGPAKKAKPVKQEITINLHNHLNKLKAEKNAGPVVILNLKQHMHAV